MSNTKATTEEVIYIGDLEQEVGDRPQEAGEAVYIGKLEEEVGDRPQELGAHERARLTMAYVVLGGVAALFLLSWLSLLFFPDSRKAEIQSFFEFVKAFCPPLITLVLGYYFRDSQE
jgi:hypothetical protein